MNDMMIYDVTAVTMTDAGSGVSCGAEYHSAKLNLTGRGDLVATFQLFSTSSIPEGVIMGTPDTKKERLMSTTYIHGVTSIVTENCTGNDMKTRWVGISVTDKDGLISKIIAFLPTGTEFPAAVTYFKV